MTQKTNENPWTMDVRVRERNLKSGALTEKELEKQLAALPDLEDQTESFGTCQPALAPPPVVVSEAHDEEDDEEDDEDDDDDDDDDDLESTQDVNGAATPSDDTATGGTEGDLP